MRWRHLIVAVGIIPALICYTALCMLAADVFSGQHWVLDIVFYLFAGLAWLYPAGWVIKWLAIHEAE